VKNAVGGESGNAPCTASRGGYDAIRKVLGSKDAEINPHGGDTQGQTALRLAARGAHIDTFQFLVSLGLDLSASDAKGDGVLCYASSSGSPDMLYAALKLGLEFSSEACIGEHFTGHVDRDNLKM
jgi:ankyrin repeat protein